MMLSPSTLILIGNGARPGNVLVHPDVFDVAVITEFVVVVSVPDVGTLRMFHLPATSARFTGAGAAVIAVEAAIVLVSTAASSFLAHAERTAAQMQTAMLVERCSLSMEPPFQVTDGFRRRIAEPGERTAISDSRQETLRRAAATPVYAKGTGLSRCLSQSYASKLSTCSERLSVQPAARW
jgi:hypothetical protein